MHARGEQRDGTLLDGRREKRREMLGAGGPHVRGGSRGAVGERLEWQGGGHSKQEARGAGRVVPACLCSRH